MGHLYLQQIKIEPILYHVKAFWLFDYENLNKYKCILNNWLVAEDINKTINIQKEMGVGDSESY